MAKKAVLTEYALSVPHLKAPLTIAHVSDLHERPAEDIAALIRQVKPDLIAVTGDSFGRLAGSEGKGKGKADRRQKDASRLRCVLLRLAYFVDGFFLLFFGRAYRSDKESVGRFLAQATKIAPVYMSLGNHEAALREDDYALLRQYGVTLLDNAHVGKTINGNRLCIGGLSTDADEAWLERYAHRDGFKLLLCHHPEYYDTMVAKRAVDLVLAGHNHGGQIKLFGKGVFSSSGRLFPKYDSGVFENRLVVSAGCANTFAMPRFGNPRELVVIRLTPAQE